MGDEQDRQGHMEELLEEIRVSRVVDENQRNRRQKLRDEIHKENEDPVFIYAIESCRQLCDGQEFWNLPFELRRMVYMHLLPSEPVSVHPLTDPENREWTLLGERKPRHYAQGRFVGEDFLEELWQTHLETSIFDFGEHFNMAPLIRTLYINSHGMAVFNYPLNLRLTISSERYEIDFSDMSFLYGSMKDAKDWLGLMPYSMGSSALLEHLEMLFGFAPFTKLQINLVVDQSAFEEDDRAGDWECEVLLPFIFPTLRRLAVTGVRIKLCVVHYDCVVTLEDGNKTLEQIQQKYYKERSNAK